MVVCPEALCGRPSTPRRASVRESSPPRGSRGSSPPKTASGAASSPNRWSGLCAPRVPMPRPSTKMRRTDILRISSTRAVREASAIRRNSHAGCAVFELGNGKNVYSTPGSDPLVHHFGFRPKLRRKNAHRQESTRVPARRAAPAHRPEGHTRASSERSRDVAGAASILLRAVDLARPEGDRLHLGRRRVDGTGGGRRGASARLARGDRVAPALLARRASARLRLDAHGQRRRLRARLRLGRAEAPHLRRRGRAARRVVARRPLALLLFDLA